MISPPIKNLMKAVPDVIDSSHVQLDPAVVLVYYNLIFHGRSMGQKSSSAAARHDYIKCLQAVPAWLESAKGTLMDLIAAIFTVKAPVSRIQLQANTILDYDHHHLF